MGEEAIKEQLSAREEVDEKLPLGQTAVLGFQHVLAMYAGAVAVPLIVGSAVGLSKSELAFLINADLFTCGIATLLQAVGIGRSIGIKLPVILGVSFTAVGPMIAIGSTVGITAIYGSILASGLFVFLISGYFSKLRRFFPTVVTGSVVTVIGVSLIPVAMNWAAGGIGRPDYGDPVNIVLAVGVLALITIINRYSKGFMQAIAVLLGLLIGSIVAYFLGKMNLSGVASEPWLAVTTPFYFGLPTFNLAAIASMILVAMVSMVESTGVFFALGKVVGIKIEEDDIARGLRAEGLAIMAGGVLNSFPYTTFSQNVGLVALTKIKSRYVVIASGIILMLLGILPKIATIIASIPPAVLGGAGVVMFGMVAAAGIQMLGTVDFARTENLYIIAVSVGLGLGAAVVPQVFDQLSDTLRLLFSNGIVVGSATAVILNYFMNYSQGIDDEDKEIVVATVEGHGNV